MKLIERYCKDHGIEYDPTVSPCENMAKGDAKSHHDCPMATMVNGNLSSLCDYQMNWIGNEEDASSLSIEDLMRIQKLYYLNKSVLIDDKGISKEFEEGLTKSMYMFEGISLVLTLLGFELSDTARIDKCEKTKEEVVKDQEEHCKKLEDILRSRKCCATCEKYKDGKCDGHGIHDDLDWCSDYKPKEKP